MTILAVPLVAFLSGLTPYHHWPLAAYVVVVFGVALGVGLLSLLARRFHPFLPAFVLVAANWALQIVDVVTGGRLQLNTPFGYSPIVAGRFQGLGNLAFALLAASAVVVATGPVGLSRRAWPEDAAVDTEVPRRFVWWAVVVGAITFFVDGFPALGSDVGGVLATLPAFAVIVILLGGWRMSWRKLVVVGVGTVAALAALAAVDLARPAEDRTHLGRFASRLANGDAGEIIRRKLQANWFILTSSVWTWLVPVAVAFVAFLALRRTGFLYRLQRRVPGVHPCLIGALVVGVLGFALNDSGVAIPAMMFGIVLPWVTWLLLADGAHRVTVAVGFLLAAVAAGALHHLARPVLAAPVFERENLRGRRIPVAAGMVVVLAVLTVVGGWMVVDVLWDAQRSVLRQSLESAALVAAGFGFLGLLDDLAGSAGPRGFRGHLEALSHGELTTGILKLGGGGLVAVVAVAPWAGESFRELVSGALVVALSANLGNLLDRAPGRVGKASLVVFIVLAATSRMAIALVGPAVVAGAGAGMLVPDVRGTMHARGHRSERARRRRRPGLGAHHGLGCVERGRGGPARVERRQRVGELQPGHRSVRPAALARPPRRTAPLSVRPPSASGVGGRGRL